MTQALQAELEQAVRETLANTFTECGLRPNLSIIRSGSSVADGTSAYAVGTGNERAVLLISPPRFPNVVAEDQTKAAQMRNHLGEELGSVILTPLAQGRLLGRSYALLPFRRTFSHNPLLWFLQKPLLKSRLIEWLHAINEHRLVAAAPGKDLDHFRFPLERMHTMTTVDKSIRSAAATALDRLLSGKFNPCIVPMHNDVWKGNILRSRRGDAKHTKYPFVVIDWRGSRIDGYPIYDLIRTSLSFKFRCSELKRELARATRALLCDPADAQSYVLAALGEIAMRLEQFPPERFARLARDCVAEVQRAQI